MLTNGFARKWLPVDKCPLVGRRRIIPADVVEEIGQALKARGWPIENVKASIETQDVVGAEELARVVA
jgi:hypothetical protein